LRVVNQQNRKEMLSAEVRYRRERLDLYRARVYSGRPTSPQRLRELQRAYDRAVSRLHHFETGAWDDHQP
jgi:hypothetical protein